MFQGPTTFKNRFQTKAIVSTICKFEYRILRNPLLNPGVPKCDEDLITLEIYVEQGKTMNYKVFICKPQCENFNIFGYLGGRL